MTIDKNLWAEEGHVNEDQFRFIYDVIQDHDNSAFVFIYYI